MTQTLIPRTEPPPFRPEEVPDGTAVLRVKPDDAVHTNYECELVDWHYAASGENFNPDPADYKYAEAAYYVRFRKGLPPAVALVLQQDYRTDTYLIDVSGFPLPPVMLAPLLDALATWPSDGRPARPFFTVPNPNRRSTDDATR